MLAIAKGSSFQILYFVAVQNSFLIVKNIRKHMLTYLIKLNSVCYSIKNYIINMFALLAIL